MPQPAVWAGIGVVAAGIALGLRAAAAPEPVVDPGPALAPPILPAASLR